jgi:hypothetical protein
MNQLTVALIVVIGLLGGFYSGFKYGQGHPPPSAATLQTSVAGLNGGGTAGAGGGGAAGGGGGSGGGGGGGFGSALSGQITAVASGTMTIHDASTGKDVKVNLSQARISKTTQGTLADLTPNETVTVVGQTGSDGTVDATVVAIGGGALIGRGRPAPSPSQASTS